MHSSISSSDVATANANSRFWWGSAALVAGVLLLCIVVEAGTRTFINKMSASLGRIHDESLRAEHLGPRPDAARRILLVGNSLLIADVDVPELNHALEPGWTVVRFAIEQTTYLDWFYGINRVLTRGTRPDVVLLCLEPRHILAVGVRQDIFARFLLQQRDLFSATRALRFRPTEASELFFGNVSEFFALRKELRKNLLVRLLPAFPDLARFITRESAPPPEIDKLAIVGLTRLQAFRDMVKARGSRLVVLLPPPTLPDAAATLKEVGDRLGIPVLAPVSPADISLSDFERDRYHLNVEGRRKFTAALAGSLRQTLGMADVPLAATR